MYRNERFKMEKDVNRVYESSLTEKRPRLHLCEQLISRSKDAIENKSLISNTDLVSKLTFKNPSVTSSSIFSHPVQKQFSVMNTESSFANQLKSAFADDFREIFSHQPFHYTLCSTSLTSRLSPHNKLKRVSSENLKGIEMTGQKAINRFSENVSFGDKDQCLSSSNKNGPSSILSNTFGDNTAIIGARRNNVFCKSHNDCSSTARDISKKLPPSLNCLSTSSLEKNVVDAIKHQKCINEQNLNICNSLSLHLQDSRHHNTSCCFLPFVSSTKENSVKVEPNLTIARFPEVNTSTICKLNNGYQNGKQRGRQNLVHKKRYHHGKSKILVGELKTRENYWNFRKPQHKYNIFCVSNVINTPFKSIHKPKSNFPRSFLEKEFIKCFRYSEVVKEFIKLYDDSKPLCHQKNLICNANEVLPTICVEDILEVKKRIKQLDKLGNMCMSPSFSEVKSKNTSLFNLIKREKSISLPNISMTNLIVE